MATFNKPIATNQGIALLKSEVAGTDSITFTKTVFSSDDYSQTADSDIANLTAIQSMDLTATAQAFQDVNGNTKVRAIGYNNSVNQAFYVKTYALYARNKAGNEILFAVASSQTADFVPAFNNAQLTQIAYTFTFAIDQTQNITLSDQHEVTVTQADLAGINNYVNSNASSASLAIASNASSINSVQSSVTANSSAIASNASGISNLQSNLNNVQSSVNNLSGRQPLPVSKPQDFPSGKFVAAGNPNQWDMPDLTAWLWLVDVEYASGLDLFVKKITASNSSVGSYERVISVAGLDTGWYRPATSNDVNQINANMQYLSNRTGAIEQYYFHNQRQLSNTDDLNNVRATGTYTINNIFPQNMPTAEVTGSNGSQSYLYNDYLVVVFSDGTNVQQELINSALGTHYQRSLYSTGSSNWQKLVTEDGLQSNSNSSMIMHGVINQNGDVDLYNITTPGAYIIDGDTNHRKPNHWPFEPSRGQWGLLTVYEIAGILFQEIKTGDGYYAYRWQGWGWHTMSIPASSNPNGYTWS